MKKCDVVVVGACTAGTYLANLLAKAGYQVVVVEKDTEENLCKRLDIFHFTRDSCEQFGIDESVPGDPEFVHNFDLCISKSALDKYPKNSFTKVAVLHLPLFIKRLQKVAKSNGVEFVFGDGFEKLRYEEGKIHGIFTHSGEEIDARLVVDASGIPSVVRRQVNDPFVETFEIGPRDKFYVLLKYVQLTHPEDEVKISTSWPYYKGWIAPQHNDKGAIVGVGANLSYDYARKCMAKFEANVPLPEYTLQYEELGCTPYRRPPYSFVTDGFFVTGDAACLTKPFNGEGIPSSWVQEQLAADVICEALKDGAYPTKERLWKINTLYQRGEGAEYASLRALLIGAVDMSPKDNDFLFANSIVFKGDDEEETGNVAGKLIKGVLTGKLSGKAFGSLNRASKKGTKVKKLYQAFPETPEEYAKWKQEADAMWNKIGSMADTVHDE